MRHLRALLLGSALGFPLFLSGAQIAQTRFYCLSLKFGTGTTANGVFTLELTTGNPANPANGELAPLFGFFTHSTGFVLHDPSELEPINGAIAVNVPPPVDVNQNGFEDFFEVSRASGGTTTGAYMTAVDDGTVQATWNRSAGSKDGTCVLRLTSNAFGLLGDFTHPFELIEFTGPLIYAPRTNGVTASVSFMQTGNLENRLGGIVDFIRSPTNRFNKLELLAGAWTNASGQSLSFGSDVVLRDVNLKTNYYGGVEFADGDPQTSDMDYTSWVLSIDDPNDADGDGIPDLTDDPESTPARSPSLRLALSSGSVVLTLSGTIGLAHEIQEIDSLSSSNWTMILSVTPTNDPQTVELSVPAGATRFWRALVR